MVTKTHSEQAALRHLRASVELGALRTESGALLPNIQLAYETWGELNEQRTNAILVLHALTGDAHVNSGCSDPQPGWWEGIIGPGAVLDTRQNYIVAANVLGGCYGSTGPASLAPDGRAWGSRFPRLTTRDFVAAEVMLADYLGIDQFKLVVGPSAGGHRALEWACGNLERVRALVLIASAAATTADQAAWASMQLRALQMDPHFNDGDYYESGNLPAAGLALARQIAHATYRCAGELDVRFGREHQEGEDPLSGGRLAVQSYFDYHGEKLVRRFDAGSYRVMTQAMITHDVGRGRDGVRQALGRINIPTLVLGVDTDRLFPLHACRELAHLIPKAQFAQINSPAGHDGFLIERTQVEEILTDFIGTLT